MSLVVAVPAALGAAAAFGVASALQHAAAHEQTGGGRTDVRALPRLLTNLTWLGGVGADTVGLALLVLALANGPVTVVQPLQVLLLLVALAVSRALGGPRLTRRIVASSSLVIGGLGAFFVAIGNPGEGRPPDVTALSTLAAALLLTGGAALLACRRASPRARAVVFGVVSGAWFGLTAVQMRALELAWTAHGISLFGRVDGWLLVAGLLLVGGLALALTQAAFQVGPLAASLPGQILADPVLSVVVGATLLGEHVPLGMLQTILYLACLVLVSVGVTDLARHQYREALVAPASGGPA